MKRRHFLVSTACFSMLPSGLLAKTGFELIASEVEAQILPEEFPATALWGYNGGTPGPLIRSKAGETLTIEFENHLEAPSSVHWHGVRVENAMDGVSGLTQAPVEKGKRFDYSVRTPDAGTFWYHAHHRSHEQVARGLFGALIVEETNPPIVDHDEVIFVDDWQISQTGELNQNFENMHDQAMAGALGNYARILTYKPIAFQTGDRARLRIMNVATDRVFPIAIEGVVGKIVALDGMPLEVPVDLNAFTLAPAQRLDCIVDITARASESVKFIFATQDGSYELGSLPIESENRQINETPIQALPQNTIPKPNLANAVEVPFRLEGGMGRGMMGMMGSSIWTINGKGTIDETPLHVFKRNETGILNIVNDSGFPHGIHLHGHHFQDIRTDKTLGPYRDTILLEAGETKSIACVFDNPGKWLIHCHMLGHQASGMKTWLKVK